MAKIAFIILAHENAGHIADFARLLTEWNEGAHAVIHYDLNSPDAQFQKLKAEAAQSDRIHLVKERIRCGWGDFSLVESVLRALRLIRDKKIACDRVMLVSGACMPIRPLSELSDFLDAHPDKEFIETFDEDWIVGGLRAERYKYHHLVNHRRHYNTFRYILNFQKALKLTRKLPPGIVPKFGSQWWTLTWPLCERILGFLDRNPDVYRFFRTTWIPDELFFQSLSYHLVASENMAGHNLTFYQFNDWGMPLVFSDSHMPLLETIPRFFARKIGGGATALKKRLAEIAREPHDNAAPLPELPPKWRFPAREIAARNARLNPGHSRLFADNGTQSLLESLLEYDRSFVILYGPPDVTARTIEMVRNLTGYTVLGRIFHPNKVDFGAGIDNFHGLKPADAMVRDEYPVNYMRRILMRCPDVPVFTMSPGDNAELEVQFFQSRQAEIFTLMPRTGGQMWHDLYWLLCAEKIPHRPGDNTRFLNAFLSRPDSLIATDSKIKDILNEALFSRDKPISQAGLETYLTYAHGEAAKPIMHLYQIIAASAMSVDFKRTLSVLPEEWRNKFKLLENGQPVWKIVPNMKLKHIEVAEAGVWNE
jgi:hypothetical protein